MWQVLRCPFDNLIIFIKRIDQSVIEFLFFFGQRTCRILTFKVDDVKRSVNVRRPYLEPFEDVRPVVELRCEVGTVSGLVKRNWSKVLRARSVIFALLKLFRSCQVKLNKTIQEASGERSAGLEFRLELPRTRAKLHGHTLSINW